MRIQHRYLTFTEDKNLVRVLDRLSIKYTVREKSYDATTHLYALEFHLYEENPRFAELKDAIDRFKIVPQIGTLYERADVENAEWFIIMTGEYQYPQPEDDFGYLKETFNLDSYCKLCDIGKTQNAPYRLLKEPGQLNNQFWGLHWAHDAIFVRQAAKDILEKANVNNIRFSNPVLHKKNIPIVGFYQLHVDTILSKGFDNYNTKTITCKVNNEENWNADPNSKCCGRVKFHHPMIGGYMFDKHIFDSTFDIVESNEYFGGGGSAMRLQIASRRFKEIVEKNKLKGLSFTPIVHDRFKRIEA